eukprot:m.203245 g.203245  ORF g.203245 m.203245 type:complete len:262 (-) comp18451_c0_seq4:948-1733(-)
MGSATSTLKIQNDGDMDAIVVATLDSGEHRVFSAFVPTDQHAVLKVSRNSMGKVKAYVRTIYSDGFANQFRMGVECKATTDEVLLRRTDVRFNSETRGSPVKAQAPTPNQMEPAKATERFAIMNGTPWQARIRITVRDVDGFHLAPIDLEVAPAAVVKMDLSPYTNAGALTRANFVVSYANNTAITFQTAMETFIPQLVVVPHKTGRIDAHPLHTRPPEDQILLSPSEAIIAGVRKGGPTDARLNAAQPFAPQQAASSMRD